MTCQIPLSIKSRLPFDLDEAVEQYRQAMLDHRHTVNVPAPVAPDPIVEMCVRRVVVGPDKPDDFVADYEVFDDTPPSPEVEQAISVLRETVG